MTIHAYAQLLKAYAKERATIDCNSMSSYDKHSHALYLIECKLYDVFFKSSHFNRNIK